MDALEARSGAYRRILANSSFRNLWLAGFISGVGDWLIVGILIPTALALSGGSSAAVAGIMIAKIIPALLFSSVVGVLVDYYDRRHIMLATDAVRFVLVLMLLFTDSLLAIYLVLLLMETASLFFWPARNALIPHLVESEDLRLANGLMYTTQQASMIFGLAASATLLVSFEKVMRWALAIEMPAALERISDQLAPILVGSRAGFLLDSLTFVVSFLLLLRITTCSKPDRCGTATGFRAIGTDVVESVRFLAGHAQLRALLTTIFLAIVGGGAIIPVGLDHISTLSGTVPLASQVEWLATFAGSRQTFILTFLALGMVAGAITVPRLERTVSVRVLFPASIALFAVGMLGFAMTDRYFVAALFASGAGLCISALSVSGANYIATEVADELRGRVFTAMESVIRVSLLISMVAIAPLSDLIGGIVRRFLSAEGIVEVMGIPITGARMTLVLASGIVAGAAVYGYRSLYSSPTDQDGEVPRERPAH